MTRHEIRPLSMLQIGLIASGRQTSGSDRYYFSLLRALADLGIVHGVVLGDPAAVEDALPSVQSFAPEGSRTLRRWTGLRRAVGSHVRKSDLVVSHFAPHAFPALDMIRARPLVVHFHGPWTLEGRFAGLPRRTLLLRAVQERLVYGRAQRLIVLSNAFKGILERDYRVAPERIRVIPGGVDVGRFGTALSKEEARRRLGWPADRRIVATVRRLEGTKGVDRLIDAVDRVRHETESLLVIVGGTGSLANDFARRVAEAGMERWIRFAGFVSDGDLPLFYRAADLFVVPSVAFEGFGLVVLEALASGTPVLVTPVGGMPELVEGLDPNLVLAGCGPGDIADGLLRVLTGALRCPDEDACSEYARRFAWPAIASRVLDVYREVA